jgi:hypothetical protein
VALTVDQKRGNGGSRPKKKRKSKKPGGSLTNVLVGQLVTEPDALRLVLYGLAIDDGALELLDNAPMDGVALLAVLFQSAGLAPEWLRHALRFRSVVRGKSLTKSSTVHLVDLSTTGDE